MHCALENGADLHVNERQKIRARSTEERRIIRRRRRRREEEERRRRIPNRDFFTLRGAYLNLRYIAMLHIYSVGNLYNTMVVFKMRDSVPSTRYCVNGESGSSLLIESTDSMIYISYVQPFGPGWAPRKCATRKHKAGVTVNLYPPPISVPPRYHITSVLVPPGTKSLVHQITSARVEVNLRCVRNERCWTIDWPGRY